MNGSDVVRYRPTGPRRVLGDVNVGTVAEMFGEIVPGLHASGMTKGQVPLVEAVGYILATTGPADVTVATWELNDVFRGRSVFLTDQVRSCRWIIDRSFVPRRPSYIRQLVARYGVANVRIVWSHAKFVLIRNAAWSVVLRTSQNLDRKLRLEQFDLTEGPEVAGFVEALAGEIFAEPPFEFPFSEAEAAAELLPEFDYGDGMPRRIGVAGVEEGFGYE